MDHDATRHPPPQHRHSPPEDEDAAIDEQRPSHMMNALPQEDGAPFLAVADGALDPLLALLRPADDAKPAREGLAQCAVRGDEGEGGVRGPLAGGHGGVERLAGGGENDGVATRKGRGGEEFI